MDLKFCACYLPIPKSSVICVNNRKGGKQNLEQNKTTQQTE